jgi:CBS domain-containing protein
MEIVDLIKPTGIAQPGMSVQEAFRLCVEADVPGIPFKDREGEICGKVSIRHILKATCIPDFMVRHSHLLGDQIHHLAIPCELVREVMGLDIDDFVLPTIAVATSRTSFAKALAIMEDIDTTYLFVIDNGDYKGMVSVMGIARAMLDNV